MVRMGTIWDRAVEVLNGRTGILASIAFPTLFLPGAIHNAFVLYAGPPVPGAPPAIAPGLFLIVGFVLGTAALILAIWGQLALLAVATDPAVDRAAAYSLAASRLFAAIGIGIVVLAVLTLASLPFGLILAASGIDMRQMMAGNTAAMTGMSSGAASFLTLYAILYVVALIVLGARLLTLHAVVLRERLGIGAIPRAWRMTRGLTWRLIGVLILFFIVFAIATSATQLVVGLVFRLALGAEALRTAAFLTSLAVSAVSLAFSVVALAFVAQLYVALVERQPAAA